MALLVCLLGVGCGAEDSGGSSGAAGARPGVGGDEGDGTANPFGNRTGSVRGVAGSGAGGVASSGPVTGDDGDDRTCAEGEARTSPVTPNVWLVIDSSGSMEEDFGGTSRWQALRSALMDPGGIVSNLERAVRFGMVIYSGAATGGCNSFAQLNPACGCALGFEPACCTAACGYTPPTPTTQQCVDMTVVDPALMNYLALDAAYPAQENGGWTPTDRAIEHVVSNLPVVAQQVLDADVDPTYVVLATDGAPNDNCGGGGNLTGASGFDATTAQRVVDQVTAGVGQGMSMFVISLAGGEPDLRTHLEQVAEIGKPGEAPFEPATKDELVATLRRIIGEAACQVGLNGSVNIPDACRGTVKLNGQEVGCNDVDGWEMADERTVRLTGAACDNFLSTTAQVIARFPCGVFTPD